MFHVYEDWQHTKDTILYAVSDCMLMHTTQIYVNVYLTWEGKTKYGSRTSFSRRISQVNVREAYKPVYRIRVTRKRK